MPNWCNNEVEITTNNLEQLRQFLADMGWTAEQCNFFSFNSILPVPEEIKNQSWSPRTAEEMKADAVKYNWPDDVLEDNLKHALTEEEMAKRTKQVELYGADNAYDWCIRHWGTKWEPCDVFCHDWDFDSDYSFINFTFDTAWGPPEEWFNYVNAKYPDLEWNWFYKEPGVRIAGWL